jgi:hypothetical protein
MPEQRSGGAAPNRGAKLDAIPKELREEKYWVLWRYEERNGKKTKVPYQVNRKHASSDDTDTCTTFEQAKSAYQQDDFFDGIGFVFHPNNLYCGADLDDITEEQAERWIRRFDSYTEGSPSGKGIHIICKAKVPKGTNRDEGEIYSSGRFFTMTGDVIRNVPVRDAQDAADEFHVFLRQEDPPQREHHPSMRPRLTDADIVHRAEKAKNGAKFKMVYEGGGAFKSPSERDLSLAGHLAFWTQHPEQIERIMRGSGCARDKWDKHRTYLQDTIVKALSSISEPYSRGREGMTFKGRDTSTFEETPEPPGGKPRFERIDLGEPIESGMEPPEMLVSEELYAGRVHCIYSAGGTGKTFKALWLIKKAIERGRSVLLFDMENGVRIVSDRLRDIGVKADQARRHLHYYPFPSMPLADDASAEFEALLDKIKPDLVVFDSWINCLAAAGLDENSSVDIALWAEAYPQRARVRGMASLMLDHVPKEGNTARGSGRKLDYVDVMWELRNPQKFDRKTIGRIDMHLRKDREGWLPKVLTFSVGGTSEGFRFTRSLGTLDPVDEAGLTMKERSTLEALQALGSMGAFDKDWKEEAETRGVGKSKYYEARKRLLDLELVERVMDKFFVKDLQNQGPVNSTGLPMDRAGVHSPSSPLSLRSGLDGPTVDENDGDDVEHF